VVIQLDTDLAAVMLKGSYTARYRMFTFYDGKPSLPIALEPMPTGELTASADGNVQTSGRVYIRTDRFETGGQQIIPRGMRDPLAPFGQEVELYLEVLTGTALVGSVPLGRFRITEVPTIEQTSKRLRARGIGYGVAVELQIQDRFEAIEANKFTEAVTPQGTSTWAEIRRLCPFPVVFSLPDRPIPPVFVYPESRLEALQKLAGNLDGVLHATRSGAITVRPAEPNLNFPTTDLTGTIRDVASGLSNDLRNVVVLKGKTINDVQIVAVSRITLGPLAHTGPLGPRVEVISESEIATQYDAQRAADRHLARLSGQTKEVTVACLPHPGIELGDPVKATDPASEIVEVGMVSNIRYSMNPTDLMQVTLTIPREVIPWG
jgi:hypothetical protein